MILYELAIEMGERSSEVADRARSLGLVDAGPATELTPAQEAAIRAGVPVPPSVGGGAGASNDAQVAPMAWQADPSALADARSMPTAWSADRSAPGFEPPASSMPGTIAQPSMLPPPSAPHAARPTMAPPAARPAGPRAPAGPSAPSPTSRRSSGGRSGLGGILVPVSAVVVGIAAVLLTWQFFRNAQDNSTRVQEAVQTVDIKDGSDDALVEQCRALDPADPISARLGHVCSSLTPAGTPLAAAAAAALTPGGLQGYTTPDPGRFCPAADQAVGMVDGGKGATWEARRSILIADRASLSASLKTIVDMSPPRWVLSLGTYAVSMQGQLDGLGPDSGPASWNVAEVSAPTGSTSPVEDLRIAFALSCG